MTRILLVEDNKPQAEVAKGFLEKNGYEVLYVEDGKSAIKEAKTGPIDLILLDLVLPDMSGTEVSRFLKLDEGTKGIPIIMLTVKGGVTDKVAGIEVGADDYLPKPYSEIELNARIFALLRTKALQDELREKNRQLEELLKKVESLAATDQLTGLYNRRQFVAVLEREFDRIARYGAYLSCIMIDVDHFKRINDHYGHHAGDFVLKEIARIISSSAREHDTAARWGGKEFVILLPETKGQDAMKPAVRILKTIQEHKFSAVPEEQVTVSIGISSAPDPAIDSAYKLIQVADNALYKAKQGGRNKIEGGS